MVRFSRVGKLDGIRSWSTPAGSTCPGSFNSDGSMVDPCKGCYAKFGRYHMPNVNEPREHNALDWKRAEWVADMVKELDNDRYFRWFDSGDIKSARQAEKILEVMKLTPWVKHWLPTRSHKLPKILPVLEEMKKLSDVTVRYSSDSIHGDYEAHHGSTIIPTPDTNDDNLTVCKAYANKGKVCNGCRKCWNDDIKIIAYPAHGAKMIKLTSI